MIGSVYGDVSAVLFAGHIDALHAKPVIFLIRFGRLRQSSLEYELLVVIIMYVDGNKIAYPLDRDADDTFVRFQIGDRLHRIVDDVPEEGIQIDLAHKIELCAVHDTTQFDSLFVAKQALFGQDDVQRLVPRLDGRIIDGNDVFHLGDRRSVHGVDVADFSYLMLQIMTFQIDEFYIFPRKRILFFLLRAQVVDDGELILQFFPQRQFELHIQCQKTANQIKDAQHARVKRIEILLRIICDHRRENDVDQNDEGDEDHDRHIFQFQRFIFADKTAENHKNRPINNDIVEKIDQCREGIGERCIDRTDVVAIKIEGLSAVQIGDIDDQIVKFKGDMLRRIPRNRGKKNVDPALLETKLHHQHGDEKKADKQKGTVDRVEKSRRKNKRHTVTHGDRRRKAKRKKGTAFQMHGKQCFRDQELGHKYRLIPKQLRQLGHGYIAPPPKYSFSACKNAFFLGWEICNSSSPT